MNFFHASFVLPLHSFFLDFLFGKCYLKSVVCTVLYMYKSKINMIGLLTASHAVYMYNVHCIVYD